jgi:3alpha(or 20beta)-hydroxysteroid dehydrogenase
LTESAAVEFAHADVRVNMVTPGAIQTGFAKYGPGVLERLTDEIPLGRTATPEEVATCIAFVASPACGYMTGSELLVDGGLSMRSLRLGD